MSVRAIGKSETFSALFGWLFKCMAFPLCNCLCLTGHTSNGTPERAFGTVGYLGSFKFQTMILPKLKLKFSKPSNLCLTWKKGRKTEMMIDYFYTTFFCKS